MTRQGIVHSLAKRTVDKPKEVCFDEKLCNRRISKMRASQVFATATSLLCMLFLGSGCRNIAIQSLYEGTPKNASQVAVVFETGPSLGQCFGNVCTYTTDVHGYPVKGWTTRGKYRHCYELLPGTYTFEIGFWTKGQKAFGLHVTETLEAGKFYWPCGTVQQGKFTNPGIVPLSHSKKGMIVSPDQDYAGYANRRKATYYDLKKRNKYYVLRANPYYNKRKPRDTHYPKDGYLIPVPGPTR